VTSRPTHSGFEPRTHDAERRDFFDLRRKLATGTGSTVGWDFKGTIATPGPPTTGQAPSPKDGDLWIDSNGIGWAWNGTAWVNVGTVRGPTGATGPQGATGATGAQGPQGTAGEKWFSGTGAPAAATGAVNDWYTDTANGDFYEKTAASVWTLRGNMRGPIGATGSQGPQGIQGPIGPDEVMIQPNDPFPANNLVDFWYDTDAPGIPLGVPAGGLTGQVLTKKSSTDQDTQWAESLPPNVAWGMVGLATNGGQIACPLATLTYLNTAIAITLRVDRMYRFSFSYRAIGRQDAANTPSSANFVLYDNVTNLGWIDHWIITTLQWTHASGYTIKPGDGVARQYRIGINPPVAWYVYPTHFMIEDIGPVTRTAP
jgi:hypothetical protein